MGPPTRFASQTPIRSFVLFAQGTVNFKFGVLYCKEDQTQETDMFSNGNDNPD